MKLLILIQLLYIIYLLLRIKRYKKEITLYKNLRFVYIEMIREYQASGRKKLDAMRYIQMNTEKAAILQPFRNIINSLYS